VADSYKELLDRRKELMTRLTDLVFELAEVDRKLEPLGQAVDLLSAPEPQQPQTAHPFPADAEYFDLPAPELVDGPPLFNRREEERAEMAAMERGEWPRAQVTSPRAVRGIGEHIAKLAVRAIKECAKGEPLSTRALLVWMQHLDPTFQMSGQKPLSNLAAHLSHHPRFQRTSRGWVLLPKGGEP
jgi:hypothetical protein